MKKALTILGQFRYDRQGEINRFVDPPDASMTPVSKMEDARESEG
jgi:hypothetical protein